MQWLLKRILGTKNERDLKRLRPFIARINEREQELQALADAALQAKTGEFKERLAKGETIDDLMEHISLENNVLFPRALSGE